MKHLSSVDLFKEEIPNSDADVSTVGENSRRTASGHSFI